MGHPVVMIIPFPSCLFQPKFGDFPVEEEDNYDSDMDAPFMPPAIPEPDEDYDSYSDEDIPEDEIQELDIEGKSTLDELRRRRLS